MQKSIFLAALAGVLALPVAARQGAPQPPPVFHSATDIVEVDVVVHDKAGGFVADLKPEDFEVHEDGKPQTIDLFYLVGAGAPAAAAAAPGASVAGAAASPVVAVRPRAPRIFVVVFDDEHLTPAGFKRVQAAARTLFEKHFQNGDIGGVLAGGRMINNRLTSDGEELVKAIRTAAPRLKGQARRFTRQSWPRMSDIEAVRIQMNNDRIVLDEVTQRACGDEPTLCPNADAAVRGKAAQLADQVRTSSNLTVQALTALFNGLEPIDGRKTVLLMSEGFFTDQSWPLVQQAVGLAARANARLYTLDARGLDARGMADYLSGDSPSASGMSRLLEQFDEGADAMNSLAADTGGFVVRNRNNLDDAVARIVDDTRRYYVLGYRPDTAPDGKFRKISVKATRPDLEVRARRGYVATPRPTATPTATAPAVPADPAPRPDIPPAARPEPVEGRAPRPNAAKNVETLVSQAVSTAAVAGAVAATPLRSDDDAEAVAGWAAYRRGDLEAARTALALAANEPAARPWVHYALGQSDYALGHFDEAVTQWEHVRSSAPEFEPVYFDLVDGYLQQKQYPKAAAVLIDAIGRWPKDPDVLNALGVVDINGGAIDDAVRAFEAATKAAAADAVGYFNLARALEIRYIRARSRMRSSVSRTWSIANGGDRDAAIRNYRRCLEIDGPLAPAAREGLKRLGAR